jgi:hypothetical protein
MRPWFKPWQLNTVLFALAFLGSCAKKPNENLLSARSPMADSIKFEYAVYMLPTHTQDPYVVLRDALTKKYPGLRLVDEIPKKPQETVVREHLQKDVGREFAPPELEFLEHSGHGINRRQAQALQKSKEAFVLQSHIPRKTYGRGCESPTNL